MLYFLKKSKLIGTIDFDNCSMNNVEIGGDDRYCPNHIGQCKIEVYYTEGPVPHFHITGITTKFFSCVRIDTNKYFFHNNYKDKLSNNQSKLLNLWLDQYTDGKRNWDLIKDTWNAHSKYKVKNDIKKPDYDIIV